MAFEFKSVRRQKVRYNNDNDDLPLTYQLVVSGAKVTPTSATIAVYKPGSTTAVLAATAMTKSGTLLTYNLDTTTVANFPVDSGFRARIVTTVSSTTYEDDLIFDVCKYILRLPIGRDQLFALDARIKGMNHGGDEDFSDVIESVRDEVQNRIEAKVVKDKKLLENMILDNSRIAIPTLRLVLGQIMRQNGRTEDAEYYEEKGAMMLKEAMATIKYDDDQDLEESGEVGGLQGVRLLF